MDLKPTVVMPDPHEVAAGVRSGVIAPPRQYEPFGQSRHVSVPAAAYLPAGQPAQQSSTAQHSAACDSNKLSGQVLDAAWQTTSHSASCISCCAHCFCPLPSHAHWTDARGARQPAEARWCSPHSPVMRSTTSVSWHFMQRRPPLEASSAHASSRHPTGHTGSCCSLRLLLTLRLLMLLPSLCCAPLTAGAVVAPTASQSVCASLLLLLTCRWVLLMRLMRLLAVNAAQASTRHTS